MSHLENGRLKPCQQTSGADLLHKMEKPRAKTTLVVKLKLSSTILAEGPFSTDADGVRDSSTSHADHAREFEAAKERLFGLDSPVPGLPGDVRDVTAKLLHLQKSFVAPVAARCRRGKPELSTIADWLQVKMFLNLLDQLEIIDPEMKTKAGLDKGLKCIFEPTHKLPSDYQLVARFVFDKLEQQNWGSDEVEVDEQVVPGGCDTPSDQKLAGSSFLSRLERPADDDPIFGLRGVMHHILHGRREMANAYQLDPLYPRKNAKVFGHNGFVVGSCWPSQMALLRDGAHGVRMGGISGNLRFGAYSIVVSGAYAGLDHDAGERLHYCGSNSHENASQTLTESKATKSMQVSLDKKTPIRVFRSYLGGWKFVPRAGLRYDGLYEIVRASTETNTKGGVYKRFELVRLGNQMPIQVDRPTQREIDLFERVKAGYTRKRPRPA